MIYKINPVFSEKIWGGNRLKEIYGFEIPSNKTGEAWMISGYEGNSSEVEGTGKTLDIFYKENKEMFNNYPQEDFPLLVKILDANDDLSIQVHPNNKQAEKLNNYPMGKSECWVVLDVIDNGKIIVGHNAQDKKELSEMFSKKQWDKFIKEVDIKVGDVFNIDPGTVHAIKGGTLIYELQQSSDITYRIYDYDRLENGAPRELHLSQSEEVIRFEETNIKQETKDILSSSALNIREIVNNDKFKLENWEINGNAKISLEKNRNFLVITVVKGEVIFNGKELSLGENAILTSESLESISLEGNGRMYVGYPL